ncbi:MAG: response regulator [Terriglobales bacterium]
MSDPVRILLAEDDDDDFMLTTQALRDNRLVNRVYRVKDGVELLEYLNRRGEFENPELSPAPSLILLDLNMPRMDGREALREIKSNAGLRRLPVVVLTTSRAQEDIVRAYDLGVNSFISKPVSFHGLVDAVKVLGRYWFEVVDLPEPGSPLRAGATRDGAEEERNGIRRTA